MRNLSLMLKRGLGLFAIGGMILSSQAADLVYTPNNPSFGGNPMNASGLLAIANATKKHEEPILKSSLNQTPLEQFNQTLERTVVSQLASAATSKLIGSDGKLIPGTLSTSNFTITITDMGGGVLQVTTTDRLTGGVTSFLVQQGK